MGWIKRWFHKKRNTSYNEVCEGTLQIKTGGKAYNGMPIKIYQADTNGAVYARAIAEFADPSGYWNAHTAISTEDNELEDYNLLRDAIQDVYANNEGKLNGGMLKENLNAIGIKLVRSPSIRTA